MRVVISTGVSGGGRDHGPESEIPTPVDVCRRGTGSWGTWMPGNGLHTRMCSLCQYPVCAALDGGQEDGSEANTKGHIHTHTHAHTLGCRGFSLSEVRDYDSHTHILTDKDVSGVTCRSQETGREAETSLRRA